MRRFSVAFACAGMVLLAAVPGLADRASLHDGNDAFGPLDLRQIEQGHVSGRNRMLVHGVTTYGKWDKNTIRREGSYIRILFTTDRDNRPERALLVSTQNGRLVAEMHSWKRGDVGERIYGRARIRRPTMRSIALKFRASLLGSNVDEYGWHVDSQFHRKNHPHCGMSHNVVVVCPDSAPNDSHPYAYVRHEL